MKCGQDESNAPQLDWAEPTFFFLNLLLCLLLYRMTGDGGMLTLMDAKRLMSTRRCEIAHGCWFVACTSYCQLVFKGAMKCVCVCVRVCECFSAERMTMHWYDAISHYETMVVTVLGYEQWPSVECAECCCVSV